MPTKKPKIFGIGLSKTGTTSLANALQILGYTTKDNMGLTQYVAGDLSSIDLDAIESNDALTDTPIPSFYRELDSNFPGSKFILTIRDRDGWLKSCMKQFNQRFAQGQNAALRQLFVDMYGTNVFDEQQFADGYERYVDGVLSYFKDRQRDLLIMNVAAGDGWEKLCPFLEQPVPDVPFPKANVTQVRWMTIDQIVAVARQAGLELMQRSDCRRRSNSEGRSGEQTNTGFARTLLARAVEAVRGEESVSAAVRAARKVVAVGLKKLNPEIPVVSRTMDIVPHTERRHWNHFWLVDPLDGEEAFAGGSARFTVNIALIEDGRPIYGVVHAPAMDTTYYGRMGKGAYRCVGSDDPTRLTMAQGAEGAIGSVPAGALSDDAWQDIGKSSRALSICTLAFSEQVRESVLEPSMEWHTAAAHAILASAGLHMHQFGSGREVSYNNQTMANDRIQFGPDVQAGR